MSKKQWKNKKKTQQRRTSSSNKKVSPRSSQVLTRQAPSSKKVNTSPRKVTSAPSRRAIARAQRNRRKRRRVTTLFLSILFLTFGMTFLYRYVMLPQKKVSDNVKPIQNKEETTALSLVMVGDSLIHGAVYGDAETGDGYDFRPMLQHIKPWIQSFDLAYYNQETILGGTEIGLSTYPAFNSPYEVGDAFLDAGFNLVSLSTNHTLDRGTKAILNSRNYWNQHKKEALASGSYASFEERNTPVILEKNKIRYTLLSYTDLTNGLRIPTGKEYLVNLYDEETVKKDVNAVRDQVDILLVSMHFGEEYTHTPTARQKQIAKYLASLGVDIVIGTHPHVIQPIEWIDDTLVVYSLGNFISAQRGVEKLTGLVASVKIEKKVKNGVSQITIVDPTADLVYTASTYRNNYRSNFRLYPYRDLNDEILPSYKKYCEKYMNIATGGSDRIKRGDSCGNTE